MDGVDAAVIHAVDAVDVDLIVVDAVLNYTHILDPVVQSITAVEYIKLLTN